MRKKWASIILARSGASKTLSSLLLKRHAKGGEDIYGDGVLEILQDGFLVFLRFADCFLPGGSMNEHLRVTQPDSSF